MIMEESDKRDSPKTNVSEAAQIQTESTQQSIDGVSKQPLSEPIRVAGKKWLVPSLIGLIVISLGMAGYFAYQNIQLKNKQSDLGLTGSTSLSSEQLAQTPVPTHTVEPDKTPQINSLYLGIYSSKDALFITNNRLNTSGKAETTGVSNVVGVLEQLDGTNFQSFEYAKLQNPKTTAIITLIAENPNL